MSTGSVAPAVDREWIPAAGNLAGLPSECQTLTYVSAHPDNGSLIAGVALQGLFTQAAGTDVWEPLGKGPGSAEIINRTSSIIYDPENSSTFWESGIYNAGGVYRTSDDGAVFEQMGDVRHSDLVSVDFSDPERRTLLSGTHEQSVVMRSADGGATWSDVSVGLDDDIGMAVGPHVIDQQTHLLGTKGGEAAGVFRTTDGGASWERVRDGGITGPPLVAASDGKIYWLKDGGGGVITSADDGVTWTDVPGRIAAGAPNLVELPDGRLVTMSDRFLIVSADHGTTWEPIGTPLPYESLPNGFTYSPARKAFYVWAFYCGQQSEDHTVAPDAMMRLDFDYETE